MRIIRAAQPSDIDSAADVLARAFADYPFTRHTVDADDHLRRVGELQRLYLAEIGMRCGRVWVAGAPGEDVSAVAVWTCPDSEGLAEAFGGISDQVADLHGDRASAAAEADAAMEPLRPVQPVWSLATVAVDPERQGEGLGSAVLEPGLRAAREAGVPAYLETSAERNVEFYRRLGFEVLGSVELPDGGPRTWAMGRD